MKMKTKDHRKLKKIQEFLIWTLAHIKKEPLGIIAILLVLVFSVVFIYDKVSYHSKLEVTIDGKIASQLSFFSPPEFLIPLAIKNSGRKGSYLSGRVEIIIIIKSQEFRIASRLQDVKQELEAISNVPLYVPCNSENNRYYFSISVKNFFSPLAQFQSEEQKRFFIAKDLSQVLATVWDKKDSIKMLNVAIKFLQKLRQNNEKIKLIVTINTLEGTKSSSKEIEIDPATLIVELEEQVQKSSK